MARKCNPDWCIWLDVDETFEERLARKDLDKMMESDKIVMYKFRKLYFHKNYNHFEAGFIKLLEQSTYSRSMWKKQTTEFFKKYIIETSKGSLTRKN